MSEVVISGADDEIEKKMGDGEGENGSTNVANKESLSEKSPKTCRRINRKRNSKGKKSSKDGSSRENVQTVKKKKRTPNVRLTSEEEYNCSSLNQKESCKLSRAELKELTPAVQYVTRSQGLKLINSRVEIWSSKDGKFHKGKLTAFKPFRKHHQVEYDDGRTELIDLSTRAWELEKDIQTSSSASPPALENSEESYSDPEKSK